jgi:aryl-alcohol dehydrogenase-like predicted oxidoreductase
LTGKYSRDAKPAEATRLGDNPDQDGMEAYRRRAPLARTWDVIDRLGAIAANHGVEPASVALSWLLSQPSVTSVILGARTTDQLKANLGAVDLVLRDEERALLDEASDPHPADYPYGLPGIEQRSRALA